MPGFSERAGGYLKVVDVGRVPRGLLLAHQPGHTGLQLVNDLSTAVCEQLTSVVPHLSQHTSRVRGQVKDTVSFL